MAGIELVHVPFKGNAEAMNSLMGGHVKIYFALVLAVLQHIKAGTLRPLAVTTEQRLPYLPDVPTIAELGFPGYEISSWQGVFAPAGTPKDVVIKINGELVRMLKVPEVHGRISHEGADPVGSTPEAFAQRVKSEITKWSKVIKTSGMQILELAYGSFRGRRQIAPQESDQHRVGDCESRQHRNGRPCPEGFDHERARRRRKRLDDQARKRQASHQRGVAGGAEQRERQRAARDPHDAVAASVDHDRNGKDRERHQQKEARRHQAARYTMVQIG